MERFILLRSKHILFIGICICFPFLGKSQNFKKDYPESIKVTIENELDRPKESALAFIDMEDLLKSYPLFNKNAFVVLDNGQEIPSQYNSADHTMQGIVLVLDEVPATSSKELEIRFHKKGTKKRSYAKRTQAELSHKVGGEFKNRRYEGGTFKNVDYIRLPEDHTDHSYWIRYEGPGWESDKVGYRFYLDWRNATDVYGKKVSEMVLQDVGQDGFDSYHKMQDWGMDVLKVGKALGVGSLAHYFNGNANRVDKTDSVTCRIVENGSLYSAIKTDYYGWKVSSHTINVVSNLSILAGSRLTRHLVEIDADPENLSTGIGKDKNARFFYNPTKKGWTYMATYGPQSLNKDKLGLAVIFRNEDLLEVTEDPYSHVVQLKPRDGKLEYYFLAAWELEKEGITDESQFVEYLDRTVEDLDTPLKVNVLVNNIAGK